MNSGRYHDQSACVFNIVFMSVKTHHACACVMPNPANIHSLTAHMRTKKQADTTSTRSSSPSVANTRRRRICMRMHRHRPVSASRAPIRPAGAGQRTGVICVLWLQWQTRTTQQMMLLICRPTFVPTGPRGEPLTDHSSVHSTST